MYKLTDKQSLGPDVTRYEIEAPRIAASRLPGQFAMIRPFDHSERIPLTIADVDKKAGTISFIVQTVGKTTAEMTKIQTGQGFQDVAGPMGHPSHVENYGTVVVVGGGLGTAVVYPQAVALKEAGNKIISIIGSRSKELLILEELLDSVSDQLLITTNDGSKGQKGFVTDALKKLIEDESQTIGAVYCAGPVIMMKAVSNLTKDFEIPTIVSLNPVMVDGTGMCGGCRVTVGGKTKFACVDGPEFDGHLVDFDELMARLTTYNDHETKAVKKHKCRLQQ